ncbi:MAG: universal stress protein [Bryobacteraceae bacterium]
MFQLKRILVPIDFSPHSEPAARLAASLACRFHSEISLLHVVEPGQSDWAEPAVTYTTNLEEERARERLDEYLKGDSCKVSVNRFVLVGNCALQICRFSEADESDLIVVPTRGYGVFRRLLLGSTTAKLLHDAKCPIMTGKHLEDAAGFDTTHPARILCAVDLGATSERVVGWARDFGGEIGVDITIAHIVLTPEGARQGPGDTDLTAAICESDEDRLRQLAKHTGVAAHIIVRAAPDIRKAVCDLAANTDADLVVVGRGERVGARLKPTTYSIIANSPCPVVSV